MGAHNAARNLSYSTQTDNAAISGNLTVAGAAAITGAAAMSSTLAVGGALSVVGGASVGGALSVVGGLSATGGTTVSTNVTEYTTETTLLVPEIVGTDAGNIGHSAGATLVAAPGAGYALEFVSAVLFYNYDTAQYGGGGDDTVIQNGSTATALTAAIAGADLLEAAGDKIVQVNALAASDQALVANKPLSLQGTALTDPGTAVGTLRCVVKYRKHATGL